MKFMNKLTSGFKQFLVNTALFLVAFIVVSFIIGQRIVGSPLLYDFGIYIYGGMGYILLFSLVGFILIYRERLLDFKKAKRKAIDYVFLVVSLLLIVLFYVISLNIENVEASLENILVIHGIFLAMLVLMTLGIFTLDFAKKFYKDFKKEILYFLIFGIITYSLMNQVWKLWPFLSNIVSKAVYFMLKLISDDVRTVAPDILVFKTFGARIGEACSGVFSIFLFSALYLLIVFLDWSKINKLKAGLMFVPAVLGAFAMNILRVFVLMVVGAYLSPEAALGLYHSYTGMIFFLIYFIVFWALFYKWMKR